MDSWTTQCQLNTYNQRSRLLSVIGNKRSGKYHLPIAQDTARSISKIEWSLRARPKRKQRGIEERGIVGDPHPLHPSLVNALFFALAA